MLIFVQYGTAYCCVVENPDNYCTTGVGLDQLFSPEKGLRGQLINEKSPPDSFMILLVFLRLNVGSTNSWVNSLG